MIEVSPTTLYLLPQTDSLLPFQVPTARVPTNQNQPTRTRRRLSVNVSTTSSGVKLELVRSRYESVAKLSTTLELSESEAKQNMRYVNSYIS